jgi:mRNA interferase YafQ
VLKPQPSTQFKRDLKRSKNQNRDIDHLQKVIILLASKKTLPNKYRDHALIGDWHEYRECHISPDWLLIYRIDEKNGILKLMRINSHANIFKK